ncbi:MAG: hypothetical protein LUQ38_05735, partial [Methanotrichaceae archaeon]|nr:hypothetical protein [Methanotrichaceae archaeon]
GTRQDLRNLIDSAHDRKMYVILDVVYNHTGNNWFYCDENTGEPQQSMPYRSWPIYPFHGWRSGNGDSISRPLIPEDGVWPEELQNIDWYTRAGQISNWETAPWEDLTNPNLEFRRGDFYELKKLRLEDEQVIRILARIFQYWIALTDCDGFRVDAVKHVSVEVSHRLCTAIHGFALSIGKENFFLVGEIMNSSIAPAYIDIFGGNLDAVLGIIDYPNRLTGFVKGEIDPNDFFLMYDERTLQGMARQIGRYVVHVLDDHDMCARAPRKRFAAHGHAPIIWIQTANAVGVLLTSPGIPSIYYGTEQAFDGTEERHDFEIEPQKYALDRYIRETMFGGAFGAFETENCHFFNQNHPTYVRISAIARLRNRNDMIGKTLRRGHFYGRETSYLGQPFSIPKCGELAAWSMVLYETEVLMVLNTNAAEERGADVTVDAYLHPDSSILTYIYKSNWSPQELSHPPEDQKVVVKWQPDGRATVHIDMPPACMAILA